MGDVYAYRLKKNYEFIVRDLEPGQVLNYLYQEDVIDGDVRDEIRAEKTRKRQAEALLDSLAKRGPIAIQQLITGLQKSSQKHLAEILNKPLQDETSLSGGSSAVYGPSDDDEICYPMKHNPCGLAIIINNYIFNDNTLLEFREGSAEDAVKISNVFQKLKFTTILKTNLTMSETKEVIRKYSLDDHTNRDCFVLFFMSHGTDGGIYTKDGKVLKIHEDITGKFNSEVCPTLANKPKLFFIQACRGKTPDIGVDVCDGPRPPSPTPKTRPQPTSTESDLSGGSSGIREVSFCGLLPRDTDVFIGFASSPKHAALRNTLTGGWFASTLCDVMMKYSNKEDLLSMMTRVNGVVNERKKYPRAGEGNQILMQAPEQHNRLRKKVYFNAG